MEGGGRAPRAGSGDRRAMAAASRPVPGLRAYGGFVGNPDVLVPVAWAISGGLQTKPVDHNPAAAGSDAESLHGRKT